MMANVKKADKHRKSTIKVNFIHPTDGRMVTVSLDSALTPKEIIKELSEIDFISSNPQGYGMAVKGGTLLPSNESLYKRVKDGDTLRIIPATDAG